MKNTIIAVISTVITAYGFSQAAWADRCDPAMLAKLPANKRASLEERCAEKAAKPAYTISNSGKEASEPMPENKYDGDDLDDMIELIEDAWEKKHPQDKVLAVRITAKEWKRNVNYKSNSTSIYKNDTSVLTGAVVVKHDNRLATIFPAYVNRDNQSGELNTGVATKSSEYVIKQMLLENVD